MHNTYKTLLLSAVQLMHVAVPSFIREHLDWEYVELCLSFRVKRRYYILSYTLHGHWLQSKIGNKSEL